MGLWLLTVALRPDYNTRLVSRPFAAKSRGTTKHFENTVEGCIFIDEQDDGNDELSPRGYVRLARGELGLMGPSSQRTIQAGLAGLSSDGLTSQTPDSSKWSNLCVAYATQ